MVGALPSIRRSRSLLLLISLVVLLLAVPNTEGSKPQAIILLLLFVFVLSSAVFAVAGSPLVRRALILLAAPWVIVSLIDLFVPGDQFKLAANVLFMVFGLFVVSTLLTRIVAAKTVDFEVVCASPAIYLLLAIMWAVSYQIIFFSSPGAFAETDFGAEPLAEFLYLSLVTITTLGYGDITPLGPGVRIWAALEAVVGVFYMAVLVARLVSLYRP